MFEDFDYTKYMQINTSDGIVGAIGNSTYTMYNMSLSFINDNSDEFMKYRIEILLFGILILMQFKMAKTTEFIFVETPVYATNQSDYDFQENIKRLLSDGNTRKTKDIINELKLEVEKSYLNRVHLYPMMKEGVLTNKDWYWSLN
jgi:hypothetical protein